MAALFNPDKIRELRMREDLTTKELGAKISVSDVAISKWELGKAFPNPNNLKSLADFFEVQIDCFFTNTA